MKRALLPLNRKLSNNQHDFEKFFYKREMDALLIIHTKMKNYKKITKQITNLQKQESNNEMAPLNHFRLICQLF